jgi:hypothetical protein
MKRKNVFLKATAKNLVIPAKAGTQLAFYVVAG